MVTNKKQARKSDPKLKGKARAEAPKPVPVKEPSPELPEEDEDEESDEDDDGVDEEGMQRLMELVNPEDLDDFEMAQLTGGEEESDGEDEEDEDEDEEEEESKIDEDDELIVDEQDAGTLAVDELGSDVSMDEDAVPQRKVTNYNAPAMRILTESIKMTSTPWPEHLILESKSILDVDPADDLKREMAFYKLAHDAIPEARKLCAKYDLPFSRPNDYYAEMVKSDEHMERVRSKLVEEATGIKKSEEAKKQRDLKKYGKQIQHEKLKQREQDKKTFADKVQGLKRKRKDGMEIGGDDDFGVEIENDDDEPRHGSKAGRGPNGKSKVPRHVRDAKYSMGKSSRRAKQNTRESANDIPGWGGGDSKKGKGGPQQRPGKARRHSRRK